MPFASVTPELKTLDLERTVRFYTEILGFELDGIWPEEEPTLAFLDHGSVHLMFYGDERDEDDGEPKLAGQLRFETEGVAELFERIADRVEVLWGPEVYHYGRREFSIRDPNGYALVFSEPTDDPPTCADD